MPVSTVKIRKHSYILTALFLVAVCYFVFSWVGLQGKAQEQKQNIDVIIEKKEALLYENAEKARMLLKENETEYLERKARLDDGFVLPGERVYYDVSAGNN
jgi:hypothetical protein